jgi:endonuclease/exonuclease/phosphatase family metal-dependent hydrolase
MNAHPDLRPLKVLSWNIYMLPAYAFETQAKYKRGRGISEELLKMDYDIIVFQEAFHATVRGLIARRLAEKYPYQYGPGNNKPSVKGNSGIWIVSNIPLCNRHEIRFRQKTGTDALARKGAMLLEGCWYGHPFQIIGTHLQASAPYHFRKAQFMQLHKELLSPHQKKRVPQFICGDLNTCDKNKEEYNEMLSILQAENEAFPDDCGGTSSSGRIIDYVLARNTDGLSVTLSRSIVHITHSWSASKNWLSDHKAVEAIIHFSAPEPADSEDLTRENM